MTSKSFRGLASLVAVLTVAACAGQQESATSVRQQSSTTAAIAPSTTQAPASTTTEPVESIPTLGSGGEEDLEPGTYLLDFQRRAAGQREYPQVVLTVPDGWQNYRGFLVGARRDTQRHVNVSFWDVTYLYGHPCDWSGSSFDPGRTVEELVAALVDIPMRNATTPVEVTVNGYQGFMLEWSVPTDIDFASCDEGFFESWRAAGWSTDRYQQAPGQVDRLWILDMDGSRLVIDAAYRSGATEQDLEELFAVVDSIRFQPVKEG